MIKFTISAPGRIFLTGEHAKLYQNSSVMVSLDRRTTLKFCELPDEQGIIKIEFSDVHLSLNVSLEIVRNFVLSDDMDNIISNNIRFVRYVKHFITLNGMCSTHEQRYSLKLFFLLLSAFVYYKKLKIRPFHVNVFTELSIGLGSSTSFAVCLAACFSHWARLQQGDHNEFDENDLNWINHLTSSFEEFIQDCTFPIDNDVCIRGKTIFAERKHDAKFTFNVMDVPRMKILLINSNICQNKREQLQKVAKIKHSQSEYANKLLDQIKEISKNVYKKLKEIINSPLNPQPNPTSLNLQATAYAELQEHIQKNQKLLYDSGLSHPILDNICSIAQSCGFAGKLTGFGGGFVYILLPPSTQEEQITNLSAKLEAEGFNVTTTSVSCSGLRIDD